jgi:hypothetical protein
MYPMITVNAIILVVCQHYGLRKHDIVAFRRDATTSTARQIVMYLAYRLSTGSHPVIANILGRRDRTTIRHGIRRIKERIDQNQGFAEHVKSLEDAILKTGDNFEGERPMLDTVQNKASLPPTKQNNSELLELARCVVKEWSMLSLYGFITSQKIMIQRVGNAIKAMEKVI